MTFRFDEQLAVGEQGERFLLEQHSNLAPAEEREWDFYTDGGLTVEMKTDTYPFRSTPNFFIEQSTVSRGVAKPGGPYRALRDGVNWFVYLFLKGPHGAPRSYWFYDMQGLVYAVEAWAEEGRRYVHRVKNGGYHGEGYCVPRKEVLRRMDASAYRIIDYGRQR